MTTVTGHNGTRLHVTTAGDPVNPAILLIHGWSQHSLCWHHQMTALSDRFHLIAPDLRGHGASDKPDDPGAYDHSTPWANDIAAIIAQLGLDRPLLVGWSMGGYVACDYIRVHGTARISGLMLVGSAVTLGKHAPPGLYDQRSDDAKAVGMYSDDQPVNLAATVKFVRACTNDPLPPDDFATMVGYNMLVPPHIRQACRLRHEDYRPTMAALDVPARVVWGARDRVVLPPLGEQAAATIPASDVVVYDGLGHAPFAEDPDRFNAGLAEFAGRVRYNSDEIPMEFRSPK